MWKGRAHVHPDPISRDDDVGRRRRRGHRWSARLSAVGGLLVEHLKQRWVALGCTRWGESGGGGLQAPSSAVLTTSSLTTRVSTPPLSARSAGSRLPGHRLRLRNTLQ